ncbi:hypothetical protein ACKC9G_12290 [Pokkaliibacter sp. CJK22405]|uniref:hypothetical protein n=1 Tax=Pokkaliibacter sp. CJK22405 TaxID=3384615 RepID=UPI003985346B
MILAALIAFLVIAGLIWSYRRWFILLHDITNAPESPPEFLSIQRSRWQNSLQWDEQQRLLQEQHFPELSPLECQQNPATLFMLLSRWCRRHGFTIARDAPEELRLEATRRFALGLLRQDLAIRILPRRPEGSGVLIRVSLRSGRCDFGSGIRLIHHLQGLCRINEPGQNVLPLEEESSG